MGSRNNKKGIFDQADNPGPPPLSALFPHPNPKQQIQQWHEDRARATKRGEWMTKDGTVPFPNLANDHLVNILLMLRRQAQDKAEAEALELDLELGSDGWKACKPDEWDGLLSELKSRGGILELTAELLEDDVFNEETIRSVFRKPDLKSSKKPRRRIKG